MSLSDQPAGSGVTVNVELFAFWPPTLTVNVPDEAPTGTIAAIAVLLQLVAVTLVPFSLIVLPT
jgi:hypothetical protein